MKINKFYQDNINILPYNLQEYNLCQLTLMKNDTFVQEKINGAGTELPKVCTDWL